MGVGGFARPRFVRRLVEIVDGSAGVARCVFDGAAGEADGGREANGLGSRFSGWPKPFWRSAETGSGWLDDLFGVLKNSVSGQVCGGVLLSDGEGVTGAGGGEGFEARR